MLSFCALAVIDAAGVYAQVVALTHGAEERKREAGTLAILQGERATVAARGVKIETEATPIRYVAAVFGVGDAEQAIRWLILMMTLCCDPLAIALTAAASSRGAAGA
jgi:hypothetical protein